MKVILCEDVINLGEMGQTVKVADGYARNYLLPRSLAVQADSASAKEIEHQMGIIKRRELKRAEELKIVAGELAKVTLTFKKRAGEGDKLYGSVTNAHITEQLKEHGVVIDRRNVKLSEPIKTLGVHTITVKLGSGVEGQIAVSVEKDATVDDSAADIAAELKAAEEDDAAHEAAEAAERRAEYGGGDEPEADAAAPAKETAEATETPSE